MKTKIDLGDYKNIPGISIPTSMTVSINITFVTVKWILFVVSINHSLNLMNNIELNGTQTKIK